MKALHEQHWDFEGVCKKGLVFKRIGFQEYAITGETVRFVRTKGEDLYLSIENGKLVVEKNHTVLDAQDPEWQFVYQKGLSAIDF